MICKIIAHLSVFRTSRPLNERPAGETLRWYVSPGKLSAQEPSIIGVTKSSGNSGWVVKKNTATVSSKPITEPGQGPPGPGCSQRAEIAGKLCPTSYEGMPFSRQLAPLNAPRESRAIMRGPRYNKKLFVVRKREAAER